jgi:exonuclease VII large subunit
MPSPTSPEPSGPHGIRGRVLAPLDSRLRGLVDDALSPVRRKLATHNRRITRLEERFDKRLERRLRQALGKVNQSAQDLDRLQPQVASLEQRVEQLRERLDAAPVAGSPDELEEARRLLELVRREHEQVRARISAATWYEERLRLIEERLDADGA